jgi:hypothetical protein
MTEIEKLRAEVSYLHKLISKLHNLDFIGGRKCQCGKLADYYVRKHDNQSCYTDQHDNYEYRCVDYPECSPIQPLVSYRPTPKTQEQLDTMDLLSQITFFDDAIVS